MNKLLILLFLSLAISLPVHAKKEGKGNAGSSRDEHASESGLEHGKAWAGNKDKDKHDDDNLDDEHKKEQHKSKEAELEHNRVEKQAEPKEKKKKWWQIFDDE